VRLATSGQVGVACGEQAAGSQCFQRVSADRTTLWYVPLYVAAYEPLGGVAGTILAPLLQAGG